MMQPYDDWSWEAHLLERARRASDTPFRSPLPGVDAARLTLAYRQCARITADHSFTVRLGAAMLPGSLGRSLHAMYGFARVSDDLSERQDDERWSRWNAWRDQVEREVPSDPIALAWAHTCHRRRIPDGIVRDALDGLARDLQFVRNQTFGELVHYAYGVSCTFCLLGTHVVGFTRPQAIDDATRLGIAIQLTNLLRDVGEDIARGCFYFPLDELHAHGLREADVARGEVDDRWRRFARFQIARARAIYRRGLPGLVWLHPAGRLALSAIAELYLAVLDDIEAHDYDVFTHRAGTSRTAKLRRLPGIFTRAYLRPPRPIPRRLVSNEDHDSAGPPRRLVSNADHDSAGPPRQGVASARRSTAAD